MQDTLLTWLDTLTVDEIAVRDLPCLLDIAVKIERQSAGVETSKAPVDVPIAPPCSLETTPGSCCRRPRVETSRPARSDCSPPVLSMPWMRALA